jgi:hypothetical protein
MAVGDYQPMLLSASIAMIAKETSGFGFGTSGPLGSTTDKLEPTPPEARAGILLTADSPILAVLPPANAPMRRFNYCGGGLPVGHGPTTSPKQGMGPLLHGRVAKRKRKGLGATHYPSLSNLAAFAGSDSDSDSSSESADAALRNNARQQMPPRSTSMPNLRQLSPWEVYGQWRDGKAGASRAECRVFAEQLLTASSAGGLFSTSPTTGLDFSNKLTPDQVGLSALQVHDLFWSPAAVGLPPTRAR